MLEKLHQWFFKQFLLSTDYDIAAITDIGSRSVNQDYYACEMLEQHVLLVIADGLGGHNSGELAAEGLCKGIVKLGEQYEAQLLSGNPDEVLSRWIKDAATYMNEFIARQTSNTNAHTTLALVLLSSEATHVAHIGDSRVYRLSSEKTLFQSKDDSLVQMLIDQGEIDVSEAVDHPLQNKLLKSVSYGQLPEPNIAHLPPLAAGEGILLCSDGLWGNIAESEFLNLVTVNSLKKSLTELALKAKEKGGKRCDNITAIFARPKV